MNGAQTSAGSEPIRSVLVAGAGIVGLSAATAFKRALPQVNVGILETPPEASALTEAMPCTLATIHRFHAAIGLDELELVTSGAALHRLGTRFEHWSAAGKSWFHGFGEHGLSAGNVPFHQLWLRAHGEGRAEPFHLYSAAAVLAGAGRFTHPGEDPASPLSTYLYGLSLDPQRYLARLEQAASGIERQAGTIAGAERRANGSIAALVLSDGRRLAADLYLDCTGPKAQLLGQIDDSFEDWSAWLPCDRASLSFAEAGPALPFDTVAGEDAGWRTEVRLPGRTLKARLWASSHEQEPAEGIRLRRGRRARPWVHNVIALGDAAVALDPLCGAGLHLAHGAILRAIELLPGRGMHRAALHEYNRRTGMEQQRVRDFLALHYLCSGRSDTRFWREISRQAPPDSLARTLTQFIRRGRLPLFEEESFTRDSWLAALLGLGVLPAAIDPLAMAVDRDQAHQGMAAYARQLALLPDRFPPYPQMLALLSDHRRSAPGAGRIPAIRSSPGAIGGKPFSGRSR